MQTDINSIKNFPRSNNIGTLQLPVIPVESGVFGEVLAKINFTPVRVECIHMAGYYEMIGISPLFPELKEGDMAPLYTLKINRDDFNNISSVELAE